MGDIPKVGGALKLKLQEAIPPFSLIKDSIHGNKAETLVKMVYSCWLQLFPSLLLTIPARMWSPSSFTTVSGPPLSPWVKCDKIWKRNIVFLEVQFRYERGLVQTRYCELFSRHRLYFHPTKKQPRTISPLTVLASQDALEVVTVSESVSQSVADCQCLSNC